MRSKAEVICDQEIIGYLVEIKMNPAYENSNYPCRCRYVFFCFM
jgi:hypothetical protein